MAAKMLKSLREARPGQVVNFMYSMGARANRFRDVRVDTVYSDRLTCHDLEVDAPRTYLFAKAHDVVVLEEAPPATEPKTTRVRTEKISFVTARERVMEHLGGLTGEELAEVVAEICGHDRGYFDAESGQMLLEDDVCIPHCKLNLYAHPSAGGIDWVNENGDIVTSVTLKNDETIELSLDGETVTAEEFISKIAKHLGLTIS